MNIAGYDIFTIEGGYIALDGGAMFGVVPKTLWSRSNPADEKNRIKLALRLLVLRGNGRIILVDTGVGHKLNDKLKKIYAVDYTQYEPVKELALHGIKPEEVTDVILTHFHFDHIGGATWYDGDKLKLTYPNANHYVQGEQWYWANNPSIKDQASFMPENFTLIKNEGKLIELDGPGELFPGIEMLVMYGHTAGMQLPKISDSNNTLLYCADLLPTASHIPLPYIMGYDNNPLITLEEKKRILPLAFEENWVFLYEHDPYRIAGTVEKTDKGYQHGKDIIF
jgi:glyoxylase-like metal-dependent hydrolase (beta-lactamase superfamily II)